MKISLIILHVKDSDLINNTLESLYFQTFTDYEYLIAEKKVDKIQEAIVRAKGEYCLFLDSGNTLTNDEVLNEVVLNGLDKDIIYGNIINESNGSFILYPENLRISDLMKQDFVYQSVFFRTALLKEIQIEHENYFMMIWSYLIKLLLVDNKSYKHVQFFVTRCQDVNKLSLNHSLLSEKGRVLLSLSPIICEDIIELKNYKLKMESESQKILKKIGESKTFQYLMNVRETFIRWGFYRIKSKIKQDLYYLKVRRQDNKKRNQIHAKILSLNENVLKKNNDSTDVIVSLTSYGKRVSEFAPFAIYTIFTQIQLPNRIVLFLDKSWNDYNIPKTLKHLQKAGLEIEYCEDIRSYKKLIPALKKFPNNIIITIDDDVYYNKNLVNSFLLRFNETQKKSVICNNACVVQKVKGKFLSYSQWFPGKYGNRFSQYSAIGVDAILYPPNIFDPDVLNEEVFMECLPTADDIWFWINEYRNNVKVILMDGTEHYSNVPVYHLDNWVESNSTALYFQNVMHGKNDDAFLKALDHYGLN